MRVGIAGVSSTGKSTLTKAASEKAGISAILDTDVHAAAFLRMDTLNQTPHTKFFPDMTREEHINFERAYVAARLDMESLMPDFIGDETPLDIMNYFYHVCAPHPEIMPPAEFEATMKSLWEQASKYDIIWYLAPGQIPIVDDNRRFTNKNLLEGWDFTLRGILGMTIDHEKPMLGFLTNTPELDVRVEAVVDSIEIWRKFEEQRKQMN
jgi:hypothetical protein